MSHQSSQLPDLTCVINWLENGCDPKEAAKELRIYRDIIASVKREPQWLPIESAPKDGSRVLVWGAGFHAPSTAQWYGSNFRLVYESPKFTHDPTHWMPLPAPPVTATTASREDGE